VLLAEDDDDLRIALTNLLSCDGYDVHCVRNGAEMLDVLSPWIVREDPTPPADLIITDIRMPGFDGLNIVEALRASGWHKPIVIMSAFADAATRRRVLEMGDVVLLPKPFDLYRLEILLSELVGRPD